MTRRYRVGAISEMRPAPARPQPRRSTRRSPPGGSPACVLCRDDGFVGLLRRRPPLVQELLLVEAGVQAALGEQLTVLPALHDPATVVDQDLFGAQDRGQPGGDD